MLYVYILKRYDVRKKSGRGATSLKIVYTVWKTSFHVGLLQNELKKKTLQKNTLSYFPVFVYCYEILNRLFFFSVHVVFTLKVEIIQLTHFYIFRNCTMLQILLFYEISRCASNLSKSRKFGKCTFSWKYLYKGVRLSDFQLSDLKRSRRV